jgi:4-hydroxy-4-methyl-2-oxoglutarate aldolase
MMELPELCAGLRRHYLPSVCDALYGLGLPEQLLPSSFLALLPEQRVVGAAFTVAGREIAQVGWDAGVMRMRPYLEVFEQLEPDSVLVSSTPGGGRVGHFGELTANAAKTAGCQGCVLDGNLRDVEGLREIGFQVFYTSLSPLNGIGRWEMVEAQQPLVIGDVTVNPGDIVFGEFEGILVIPRADAERVLLKAEEIVEAEGRVRDEMRTGTSPSASFDRHGHI